MRHIKRIKGKYLNSTDYLQRHTLAFKELLQLQYLFIEIKVKVGHVQ